MTDRVLTVAVVLLAVASPAQAQPPIVRPSDAESKSPLQLGAELFAGNCAKCHGGDGRGVRAPAPGREGAGPPLRGVGARGADFYLRTGYMPLEDPDDQPSRSRVRFTEPELRALQRYIASLGGGPPVPSVHPERGNVAEGRQLFTESCAGCHQVAAAGGVVTGARVPPLDRATPVQIAESVRLGPYVMPAFSEKQISDEELDSIIAYVQYAKEPRDDGGWAIGHLGPFPEGMVTWLVAAVVLVAVCLAIGKRLRSR